MLIYSQTTGEMKDTAGVLLGTGYAGHGAGVNTAALQSIPNTGPLPQGTYTIHPPVNTTTHGPYVMWLTPDSANQMFGRSGFGIHADEIANPGKRLASTGCIVMSSPARIAIWTAAQADGRQLRVTV
jgi:type VI secretion system (T6SS) effector TldE1-like protein